MVTDAQVKFFDKLIEEKEFGDIDIPTLKAEFAGLNKKSGSAWIDKAMTLPKRDESHEVITGPSF